jgi:hypothetical protein
MPEKSGPQVRRGLTPETRLFRHGVKKKVSRVQKTILAWRNAKESSRDQKIFLAWAEEEQANSNDVILLLHDAKSSATVWSTTAETPATT